MIPILDLWMPIVVAAVLVFIVSSILHMVLTYHRADYKQIPREDEALESLRRAALSPGLYFFPHCMGPGDMKKPEVQERFNRGPVGMLWLRPNGPPAMAGNLVAWFAFSLLVGFFAAYLAGRTLDPGTPYLAVFRVVGTVAFLGYGFGEFVDSIWKGQPLGNTLRGLFDGLVYALVTAGAFGWLWPS